MSVKILFILYSLLTLGRLEATLKLIVQCMKEKPSILVVFVLNTFGAVPMMQQEGGRTVFSVNANKQKFFSELPAFRALGSVGHQNRDLMNPKLENFIKNGGCIGW